MYLVLKSRISNPFWKVDSSSKANDFRIVFRKDIYNAVDLGKLGLSIRQIKAVLYVKKKKGNQ